MRADDPTGTTLRTASLAVIRMVKRRRLRLMQRDVRTVTCRRALPLDFSESRPFEASLDRNIEAVLSETTCC